MLIVNKTLNYIQLRTANLQSAITLITCYMVSVDSDINKALR